MAGQQDQGGKQGGQQQQQKPGQGGQQGDQQHDPGGQQGGQQKPGQGGQQGGKGGQQGGEQKPGQGGQQGWPRRPTGWQSLVRKQGPGPVVAGFFLEVSMPRQLIEPKGDKRFVRRKELASSRKVMT